MTLADELSHFFTPAVRERGRGSFRASAVQIECLHAGLIEASVQGSLLYYVQLSKPRSGRWELLCECPAFDNWGPCKHLWAVILSADAQLAGARARLASANSADTSNTGPAPVGRAARPSPPSRTDPGWLAARELLHDDAEQGREDPWARAGVRGTRWLYLLHSSHSLEHSGLRLLAEQTARLKDGHWGKPRLRDPWMHMNDLTTPEEVTVARHLREACDGWDPDVLRSGGGDYLLPFDLAAPLLGMLVRTERLFHVPDEEGPALPLDLDQGAPWVPRLSFEPGGKGTPCRLSGWLVRDERRVPIDEPQLILGAGLLLWNDKLAPFDDQGAWRWVSLLRQRAVIEVPPAEQPDLLRQLVELPPAITVEIPSLPEPVARSPRPLLDVRSAAQPARSSWRRPAQPLLEAHISFDYDGPRVEARDPRPRLMLPDSGQIITRDLQAEADLLKQFHDQGGQPADMGEPAAEIPPGCLPDLVAGLVELGWTVTADGVAQRRGSFSSVSVRSGIDWFELQGEALFGDQQVELPALVAALRKGRRSVRLGDGSTGLLPESWLKQWGWIGDVAEARNGTLVVPRSRGWMLDALLAARDDVQVDKEFTRFRERLACFAGLRERKETRGFHGTLRAYQRESLSWLQALRELGLGGCLADDMGLGKTVQVLAMLESRRLPRPGPGPSLVVAPRSVCSNWLSEAKVFTPRLRVVDLSGPDRHERFARLDRCDLAVTTYGLLRRDIEQLSAQRFDTVILDESQAIKNDRSQTAKAARLLAADMRLALSGTPVENHLGELWSLFEFLNPGMLGHAAVFKQLVKSGAGDDWSAERWELLSRALRPFILRRTKEQVLADLPPRTDQVIHCAMPARQRHDYDQLRQHYREALLNRVDERGLKRSSVHVLEGLLRLRQAACHPGLIDKTRTHETSAKLEVLLESLTELREEGHKALVFSQFTSFLDIVQSRLEEREVCFERLDGKTRQRARRVQHFQEDPECGVFLISLKAGGLGLNLTAADYVFVLDPWWNPAVERQATDRAHRMGQTRPVMCYRLTCSDTVEERVMELQDRKRALVDAVLGEGAFTLRDLTRDDISWLLS